MGPCRGNGVPHPQVCIVDALLCVLPAVDDVIGQLAAQPAVFFVQLLNGLGETVPKQGHHRLILHLTPSFPSSLIYYGFHPKA